MRRSEFLFKGTFDPEPTVNTTKSRDDACLKDSIRFQIMLRIC
jgi:hypothetical protein